MSPNNLYLGCIDSVSYTHKKSLNITEISFHSLMAPKFPWFPWGKKKREEKKPNQTKKPNNKKPQKRTIKKPKKTPTPTPKKPKLHNNNKKTPTKF